MHCLRSKDGKELRKTADIRKRATKFYEELYTREYQEDKLMAQQFYKDLPRVTKNAFEDLVKPLSKEELYVLQSLKNGKAPGIDGLSVDFFKAYWEFLGEDLIEVLNESLNGKLPAEL